MGRAQLQRVAIGLLRLAVLLHAVVRIPEQDAGVEPFAALDRFASPGRPPRRTPVSGTRPCPGPGRPRRGARLPRQAAEDRAGVLEPLRAVELPALVQQVLRRSRRGHDPPGRPPRTPVAGGRRLRSIAGQVPRSIKEDGRRTGRLGLGGDRGRGPHRGAGSRRGAGRPSLAGAPPPGPARSPGRPPRPSAAAARPRPAPRRAATCPATRQPAPPPWSRSGSGCPGGPPPGRGRWDREQLAGQPLAQRTHLAGQLGHALRAHRGRAGHRPLHQLLDLERDVRPQGAQRRRRLVGLLVQHLHDVVAVIRRVAGQHLVDDRSHRVDVRARVGGLSGGLLGRHVFGRAHGHARPGEAAAGLGGLLDLGALGDAEVEHLDEVGLALPADEQDVLGLEVAVDDAGVVGGLEGVAHLGGDVQRPRGGEGTFLEDHEAQLDPLDELHDEEERAVAGRPRVGDVDDVGVSGLGGRPRLAPEPLDDLGRAAVGGVQDLDRHPPPDLGVFGLVDPAHAALAAQALDAVAAGQQRPHELRGGLGASCRWRWRRWRRCPGAPASGLVGVRVRAGSLGRLGGQRQVGPARGRPWGSTAARRPCAGAPPARAARCRSSPRTGP